MNYQNPQQRTPKALKINIPSPILRTQLSPTQFSSPKRVVPVTEIIRIIPNDLPGTPQKESIRKAELSVPELQIFLDDLLKRYDKLAQDLQKSTQKEIQLQNEMNNLQQDTNNKLQAIYTENQILQETLKNKDQEIIILNQQIERLKEQQIKEIQDLKQENEHVLGILTDKLQQMNIFAKEKISELEQIKSLLQLRDQEVLEWRSRKNIADSNNQEINNLKFKISKLEQEYNQLIKEDQNLKSQFQQKDNEINILRNKLQQGFSQNDQQLFEELEQARQEIKYYQEQLMQYEKNQDFVDLDDQEDKIQVLQNEIKRLNKQLIDMRHELENYRIHQSENEFLKSKLSDKQNQIRDQKLRNAQF
ncbi:unnamed protein product [Paramecium pentaurelia]|uniref:Uncharacterized protein n=1 Tax=Paramecium pentaurelia TaxID=43138 RepID=A0A8S1X6Y2_9CILI|nr:unnamed protein product [Paramecium pentaurelia]